MGRLDQPQDPLFKRINTSVGFDRRLWPHDITGSIAHARVLSRAGVLTNEELDEMVRGLEQVSDELSTETFDFKEDDEDIHMAVERRLTEIVGPLGGKLHTGRSRNDQVATDLALFVSLHAERAVERIAALMATLVDVAGRHADWPMPGYTHLQRAQPVYLAHHLLAYFWMLRRDARRFEAAREAALAEMPLGSGALAGLNWELDRDAAAADLGFAAPSPNSIDAVSNRDAALDYLSAAAICAAHLSRLGSELVIWSSQEFGFCEPADDFASGSSIMPQKKNPDAAELLRGKAPRVAASFSTLIGVLHALPLAYAKDLQEDKEALFDAVDTIETCLEAAERMLAGLTFDRERLAAAAGDEMLAATDVADLLVRRGMPFREAHGVIGGLVRKAVGVGPLVVRADARGDRGRVGASRRRVLRGARGRRVAGVEGLRRRDGLGARCRADRGGARGACRAAERVTEPGAELGVEFYDRPVVEVARDLVGCSLTVDGVGGIITETEAYHVSEPACHAYVGLTDRTAPLFGPPGHAYVYLSYGVHSLLNAVAEPEGEAAAVLIRALEPRWGLETMRNRRGLEAERLLCAGPGQLTQALGVGLELNTAKLTAKPFEIRARGDWDAEVVGRGAADRHHAGGGTRVALLRGGKPLTSRGRSRATNRTSVTTPYRAHSRTFALRSCV